MSAEQTLPAPLDWALAQDIVDQAAFRYCEARRSKVEQFAKDNFSFFGSLRLHRQAVGLDLLRALANLLLTAPFLASLILAKCARMLKRERSANWLASKRFYLRTDVACELERRLFADFLELPYQRGNLLIEIDALAEQLLRDPRVKGVIKEQLKKAGVDGVSANFGDFHTWLLCTVDTYQSTRISSAEMGNTLLGASIGAIAFKQLTPGMISLGPITAQAMVQSVAIASFPLGAGIGGLWYGLFPAVTTAAMTIGTTCGLVAAGAVFAAFSGVFSDPIQLYFGIHQRRLKKLLDALENELRGKGNARFTVRDHYVARLFDLFEGFNVIRTAI